MPGGPKPQTFRDAIGAALYETKSYNLPARCVSLGLADGTEEEAFRSKTGYVLNRLAEFSLPELVNIAQRILADMDDPTLEDLVTQIGARGVQGELRNLIFASLAKPEIVLRDATRNVIQITRNADKCLVYDQPLTSDGLPWSRLVQWWARTNCLDEAAEDTGRKLWKRLNASVDSEPERVLMRAYSTRYGIDLGTPALLPQVWLHYDPFMRSSRSRPIPVKRQRMDFLILAPGRRCVVLEVDGKQHYAHGDRANPAAYADMVRQDRRLRLAGYEVYRFGGAEFVDQDAARAMLDDFFDELLQPVARPSL